MGAFGIGNAYNADVAINNGTYTPGSYQQPEEQKVDPLTQIAVGFGGQIINDLFYSPADKYRDQLKNDQAKAQIQAQADAAAKVAQAQAQSTQAIALYAVIGVGVVAGIFVLYKALS